MTGVQFGPLEIFVNCDDPRCGAQAMVWSGDPDNEDLFDFAKYQLPQGWTWRNKKTYCPKHS
jgi:hypothetical protein